MVVVQESLFRSKRLTTPIPSLPPKTMKLHVLGFPSHASLEYFFEALFRFFLSPNIYDDIPR